MSCFNNCYLPNPPRAWFRVQNSCSLNTDTNNNTNTNTNINANYLLGEKTAMLNKGNVLQYKVNSSNLFKGEQGFLTYLLKAVYILSALAISGGLIYWALNMMGVFEQNASKPESWGHIIFNLLLFCAMLSIIYKLANAGGFLDKNPYYRLALNIILYIPCLLVSLTNYIRQLIVPHTSGMPTPTLGSPPKPFEYIMLVLSLLLLICYFIWFYLGKIK